MSTLAQCLPTYRNANFLGIVPTNPNRFPSSTCGLVKINCLVKDTPTLVSKTPTLHQTTTMTTDNVYRVTLFKIPDASNRQKLIEMYREMPKNATKVIFPLM